MTDSLPPLNFDRSPHTGWTRAHWIHVLARLTYGYVLAAERQGSPARALLPDDRRDQPDAVDALEAFARPAVAWAAWLRNPANPSTLVFNERAIDVADLLRRGLLDGTNPANPYTYWGDIGGMDQRLVEAANLGVVIWLSRERVFKRLSEGERAQIMAWLAQVDGQETYFDNWILFPGVAQAARLHLGYPSPEAELDGRLARMAAFYKGDGWYVDGVGDEFDLYNGWMFCWHYLMWADIDGDRRPDHRQLVLERARLFLEGYQHFFGANGSAAAWGRSLVYRFAATTAFQAGHSMGVAPGAPGGLRRICSGNLRYFYEHEMFDPHDHTLRHGFHGDFPPAGEPYIAPGSPMWACNGLFALSFEAEDPFWTEREAPLPVERGDFQLSLPGPGLVVAGRQATGQVLLLNSRSGQDHDSLGHNYAAKYGKLAYSSHFPFNVLSASGSYAPDAMIALTADGAGFGHRTTTRASGVGPGRMWCEFDEAVNGEPQRVRAAVLLWHDAQVRLAILQPTLPVRAFEAPGALGCAGAARVTRRSDAAAGWEYAEAEGRALAIRRLAGYDAQSPSAPWLGYSNLNLAYPYAEQPLVFETQASAEARALASVSLLRPEPFDPAKELAGFRLTVEEGPTFRVEFPDGQTARVSLADEALPEAVFH